MHVLCHSFNVKHLRFFSSDHMMILAEWNFLPQTHHPRKWSLPRFECSWTNFQEWQNIVASVLNSNGTSSFSDRQKNLCSSINHLRQWNFEKFKGSIRNAIYGKKDEIASLEVKEIISNTGLWLQANNKDLNMLLENDEMYWRQRSCEGWLWWWDGGRGIKILRVCLCGRFIWSCGGIVNESFSGFKINRCCLIISLSLFCRL